MKIFVLTFALFALSPFAVTAAEPIAMTNADVSNITNTTALVTWQTSRESTTIATYSQSPCPCQQGTGDPPDHMALQHSVPISGLTADRTYYVQPVSIDRDGNRTEGPVLHFTTLHDTSLPTAILTNVTVGSIGDNAATVTWNTDVAIRGGSGVEYGVSPCPCNQNVQIDLGTATDHLVELAPLEPNTTYFIRPFSYHPKDANTIQYGASKTFTTNAGSAPHSSSTLVQLLYPNGGQQWNQGQQHLIAWKIAPGFVNALRIALLKDNGDRIELVHQFTVEQRTNGSSALLFPPSIPSGSYTLEIANAANPDDRDTSDATMTIGTPPKSEPTPAPAQVAPTPVTQPPPTFNPAPEPVPAATPAQNSATPAKTTAAEETAAFLAQENLLSQHPDATLTQRMLGRILLQVEARGEAWYVNPSDGKRYFLGRPADAFALMRRFALGVTHAYLAQQTFSQRISGKILLDVEEHGRAYYVDPATLHAHFLGRPADAFALMRQFGLGITNQALRTISVGQ